MFSTAFSVGNKRPQKGHSKSENSTIVTGAVAAPREGCPAVATSTLGVAGCGAAWPAVSRAKIAEIIKVIPVIIRARLLCYYPADAPTSQGDPMKKTTLAVC